ncbi:MAG TPA: ATP synthase subunit I [Limnochordales bacterium]|nr:ATP synthase subunit I [Limnochordales bacterium]
MAAGSGLGLVYFAGLWWTSQRVGRVGQPGLLLFGSFVVRAALLLGGLWIVSGGRLVPTALFMAGFVVSRRLMVARALPRESAGVPNGAAGPQGGGRRSPARKGGDGASTSGSS